jgi:hypothetical protein
MERPSQEAFREHASSYPPSAAALRELDRKSTVSKTLLGLAVLGHLASWGTGMSDRCAATRNCEATAAVGLAASWLLALLAGVVLSPPSDAERGIAEVYNAGSGGCR